MTEDTDLDRHFTRLSAEGRRRPAPDDHPAPEKLSAYLANELSPEEDETLQEHLTACPLCTELLLDLQRFLDPPEEDRPREGVADFESAAEWRELKGRMGEEKMGGERVGAGKGHSPGPEFWRWAFRLAASIVLAVLLVSQIVLHREKAALQGEVWELRKPQVGVPAKELRSTRGVSLEIPFGRTVDLVLKTSALEEYSQFRVEIANLERRVLWSGDLKTPDKARLSLRLVGGFLNPGSYRISLSGVRAGRVELLETYPVRITPRRP